MKITNRSRRIAIGCPSGQRIEEILLHAKAHPVVFRNFQNHFMACSRCARIVRKLHLFYGTLEEELAKPYSPKVVDFAKSLYEQVQPK
ncbi:hypothetical protein KC734_21735 [candidate division KSB1 bacterium]|nr:hypothetical protein [candidate division KSB1 bacterium]